MSDVQTIEKDGVTYDVVDGPFKDDWGDVYWLVEDEDGDQVLLWEGDDRIGLLDDAKTDAAIYRSVTRRGLRVKPRGVWETIRTWWATK